MLECFITHLFMTFAYFLRTDFGHYTWKKFKVKEKNMKKEVRELCKMEHHNGYKGTLYSDGTMDIYYKNKPIYLHGSNKVSSPDELYRTLELMPSIMREIKEQNDKEFGR